ncbi:MAG TPA: hypothetical protein VLC09_03005 [Polyangiaceae bacterium]|nr:hypothetical protein [Polyangiaceae bacterium]
MSQPSTKRHIALACLSLAAGLGVSSAHAEELPSRGALEVPDDESTQKEPKEPREPKTSKEPKEPKTSKETKDDAEASEPTESKDADASEHDAQSAAAEQALFYESLDRDAVRVGCVLESDEGRVVITRDVGDRLAAGATVAFLDARGDEIVVGRIQRVNRKTYWVSVALNEPVSVGDCAYRTKSKPTNSLVSPALADYTWAFGAAVKPWLGLNGDTSGFLFEGFVSIHVTERFHLRAAAEPFAPPIGGSGEASTPPALETYVAPSASFRWMEVGFGFGAGTANHPLSGAPRVGFLLTPILRVGAEDGLMVRIRSSAVVADQPVFGSFRLDFEVPVAYGLKVTSAGGGGDSGYYFVEAGLKKLMVGTGGPGTWFARVSLGAGGTHQKVYPVPPYPEPTQIGADGPYMGLGVERRF